MRQTPQFLPAHKHKRKADNFADSFSVKLMLLSAQALELAASIEYGKNWAR